MTRTILDITPPEGLKPKAQYFEEAGDTCINVDGCIALAKTTDTPQARAIYRAFRRHHAEARQSPAGRTPEKMREDAFFLALADQGIKPIFKHIGGSFDEGAK